MFDHPLHPALVHFPLALWTVSAGTDAVALLTGDRAWWTLSHHALAAGLAFGLLALLAGMAEAMLRPLPRPALRTLLIHAGCMSAAFLAFLVSLALRRTAPPPPAALVASAAGLLTLLAGGWHGGTLVYRFGIGVRVAGPGIEPTRSQR